ncbi:hypothetical protein KM043_002146 [Ampulex compressa]|nr:hypothetical protein KM043_002146 [Ampulex compressa]
MKLFILSSNRTCSADGFINRSLFDISSKITTNMKTHVLIGLLFACSVAAQPLDLNRMNVDDDLFQAAEFEFYNDKPTYVYDDDQNLVRVSMDDDDAESEEETMEDLDNRVFFYLYTKADTKTPEQLFPNDEETLKKSRFDPKKPTRIITHGWINSRKSPACSLIRNGYMAHGDYNIIVVDWSKITFRPYIWASRRVKMVGNFVSTMVDFLAKHGMDLSQTTMVGHSLGAHVMGLAARKTEGTVNYVVGLDPALPGFTFAGPGSRISSGDASHVEIIHTNAGLLGYLSAIGDSDFYPNGGSKQLGCLLDFGGACSHARSYQFFAESINSPVGFIGRSCKNYLHFKMGLCNARTTSKMGGHKTTRKARGTYFLNTKAKFPFAKGL